MMTSFVNIHGEPFDIGAPEYRARVQPPAPPATCRRPATVPVSMGWRVAAWPAGMALETRRRTPPTCLYCGLPSRSSAVRHADLAEGTGRWIDARVSEDLQQRSGTADPTGDLFTRTSR